MNTADNLVAQAYELMQQGNLLEARRLAAAALAQSPQHTAIGMLHAKLLQFSGEDTAALRAYLRLALSLGDPAPGQKEFHDSVVHALGEVFAQICQRMLEDPSSRSHEAIVACYEVVLAQGPMSTLLAPLEAMHNLARILIDCDPQAALKVTASTIVERSPRESDLPFILLLELNNRSIVYPDLLSLGARRAVHILKNNRTHLLALWVLLKYAYDRRRFSLIERIMFRLRRIAIPQALKILNQYHMLRVSPAFFGDCVIPQDFRPEYSAFAPAAAGAESVFLISCDEVYYRRAAARLAQSLLASHPAVVLHLNVVDATPETRAELQALAQSTPAFGYSCFESAAIPLFSGEPGFAFESVKTLYACSRFLVLPELLAHFGTKIVVLDADQNVVGPMDQFLAELGRRFHHDFAITLGQSLGPGIDYYADLMVAAHTFTGRLYAHLLRKYIAHFLLREYHFWTLDQVALLSVHAYLQQISHAFKLYELDSDDFKTGAYLSHYGGADIRHLAPNPPAQGTN